MDEASSHSNSFHISPYIVVELDGLLDGLHLDLEFQFVQIQVDGHLEPQSQDRDVGTALDARTVVRDVTGHGVRDLGGEEGNGLRTL